MAEIYFAGGTFLYLIAVVLIVWTGMYRKHLVEWDDALEQRQKYIAFHEALTVLYEQRNAEQVVEV